jgi:hypothetical protein
MRFTLTSLPLVVTVLGLTTGTYDAALAGSLKSTEDNSSTNILTSSMVNHPNLLQAQVPPLPPLGSQEDLEDARDCFDEDDRDDRQDCLEDLRSERFDDREDFEDDAQDCLNEDDRDDRRDCMEDLRDDYRDNDYDDDGDDRRRFRPDLAPRSYKQRLPRRTSVW